MAELFDVAVVGAGITGASTAYHLKREGVRRVLLVERDTPASGGTGKSAAIIRQHYSSPVLVRLTKASIEMLAAMPEELGQGGGYVPAGWYFLLPPDAVEGARRNVAMQQEVGVATGFIDPVEIEARLPWLNQDGVAAVVYEPAGGYADPVQATEAYLSGFQALGGVFRARTPARGLLREGDRIIGILTDDGPVAAGMVVNAAGPWAHFLARSADVEMRMRTVREQDTIWEARQGRPLPDSSISDAVDAIYIRPLGERRFVVGRGFPRNYHEVDPYNLKVTADEEFVSDVLERLERRIPGFAGCKRIAAYASLYDVTPDWYPYVGPRTGLEGYCDASGGSGHGFKLGPAIGRELALWIVTGDAREDLRALSYDRLAAGKEFVQAFGGNRG